MNRVNIYADDEIEGSYLVGWFDQERATSWDEVTQWDGSNHVSLATGSQYEHEQLHRTAGGRWVIVPWSQWVDSNPQPRFVSEGDARDWLLRCGYDAAEVEAATGEPVEPERGPGRPQIGPAFSVRFPADLLVRVDAAASAEGVTRAEWLRGAAATVSPS